MAENSPAYKKAKRRGLNRLWRLRSGLISHYRFYCTRVWRMDIHPTAQFSLSTKFDLLFRKVYI